MQHAKMTQKSPSAHRRRSLSGCIFATKARIDNGKNLLNCNISSTCLHNIVNFGPTAAEICWPVWALQQISTVFAFWLRYCSDVAQQKSTKVCIMFGRILAWYILYIYIFGSSCPLTEFCHVQNSLCVQLRIIAQVCRAKSSELKHVSTIGKNLLNSNTSSTCRRNMANFGLLTAEICWRVWGTPANFNGFRVLAALLHGTLLVGVSHTLRR